jgi:GDPmannose 4,6-dehydratase
MDITAKGCVNILEAIRLTDRVCLINDVGHTTKFYQASSSEMFGKAYDERCMGITLPMVMGRYQDENTKFEPQSPYAVAKVAAHQFCRLYRQAYNMDIRCGILFNHESERRGEEFVTRKITRWLGQFLGWKNSYLNASFVNDKEEVYIGGRVSRDQGFQFPKLRLGNLDVSRDWGHAKDYVKAMTLIMEHDTPDDWVVSTGNTHTITEFLAMAFELAGLGCWKNYVVIDETLKRPAEVPFLKGDSSKIRETLGWRPEISFAKLVKGMVEHDINKYRGSEN